MAADPALANQVHLLDDDGKAEHVGRTQAAAAIDAFESAVAMLPKAGDPGAREALDAAMALAARRKAARTR